MYILNKKIRIKIIILLLLHFWKIVNSQEDVVGGPLFPKLYLAKARAMHNLAVARARARAKPHLLLQANPEYSENTKQTDFNSYVGINAFNNENFVNPYVSYYDDIKPKDSDNIETGYAKKYPYENTNFVHHEKDPTPNRMTYNTEIFQRENFNNNQHNLNNEKNYGKNSMSGSPESIFNLVRPVNKSSTMENVNDLITINNQENFLYYPNKNSEITENETNMLNQFITSENLQDQFENKPHIYTPSNRGDENTLTFNTDTTDYSTKEIPGKYSVNNINNRTILNDPEKNNFSQKEEYPQNRNNENDKPKRLNLTSYSHEPLHFDLGKLLLTNSYPENNQTSKNLMEMENKSNEHIEDFQNFANNNSKNIELLNSNLNLVKEDMKDVDDIFLNISDEDDILNEENATNNDLQPDDHVNDEKHQLETTVGIEDIHSTVLPTSYPQGDKSNNLDDIDMTTEEPNVEINLKVIPSQPQRQEPKSMTLKENHSKCGMRPTIHTISLNNAKVSAINSEKNDTNANEEIQQNMKILGEENNFPNTDSIGFSKVFQNPVDYYHESKLQFPENLKPPQEMSRKQGDMQRTTNYEIYSNNRNFNNRQRDEQLYLWSLNNIENNRDFLRSPHAETSLKNPLTHSTIHKSGQEPINIPTKSIIIVMDPSKHPFFYHQKEESKETQYRHTFDKLIRYIADIHENKEINAFSNTHSYAEKFKPPVTDPIYKNSKRKEQTHRNNLKLPNISEEQLYPERVSSYLLHFPQNERYYGQRYRREIRDRKDKKIGKFGATNERLPLINLLTDPSAKLDVPETMKNIGSVTRNSLENENAPLYHFKNMLAAAKNAVLSAMIIPSQNLLIPTQYEIIDKNTQRNEMSNVRSTKHTLNENYLNNNNDKVFQKIGSIMKQSIHSSQQALQHVSDVAHNARKAFSSTHRAIPKLLVPYIKTPVVKKEKINKLSLITPHVTKIIKEKKSHDMNDDHIKVGMVMNALGLSHPDQEQMGNIKFIFRPKKIQPKLQSRFGSTTENEIPGYYITGDRLKDNKLSPDEVNEVIEILHKVKEVSGSRSLKDFLLSIKTHLENGNGNNATQLLNQNNETVGNLHLAGDLLKPFLGLLSVKKTDKINQDIERKGPKRRHISQKNDYREFENTAFTNFIAGYEIVNSINPEVYRFYFHEPFKVNHSADVNLKEIQHEIKNSNAIIPIEDLYNTIKNSFEETKAGMDVQESKPQEVETFPKKNS